ncbi:MAG: tetratricopeptide repeat protein [Flavobacteriales bacterium]
MRFRSVFYLILCLCLHFESRAGKVDSLMQILESNESIDKERILTQQELAREFQRFDFEKAIKYASQSLQDSRAINDLVLEAEACVLLGNIFFYKGDFGQSVEFQLKAIGIYEKTGDKKGQAAVNNNIGSVYYNQGKFEEALKHYRKALELNTAENYSEGIAQVRNNMGNLYFSSGDMESALKMYQEALEYKQRLNDRPGIALSLNNLGNVYGSTGEYEKSRDHFIRSLKISEELDDFYTQAMTLNNIGLLYQLEGDSSDALHFMRRSLSVAYKINALDLVKDSWLAIAETHQTFGNYKGAYHAYVRFSEVKDSLLNEESQRTIHELKQRYETEQKEQLIQLQGEQINHERMMRIWLIGFAVFSSLLGVFLFRSNVIRKKNNHLLASQKKIIEIKILELNEKNKNITDSITYASRIQQAILPPPEMLKKQFADAFVLFRPKDIVSGDFYWFDSVGNEVLFAVADCTGHGVPGAFMSIAGINLLTEMVNLNGLREPSVILDESNRALAKMLHQDHRIETVRDGMDIAFCALNMENKQLKFAGAFNPLWVIRNGEIIEYRGDKFPVGAYMDSTEVYFRQHQLQLQKDDSIYLFTDGFSDQFGGERGKKMKESNFRKILLSIAHLPMHEQNQRLEHEFEIWKGDHEQIDDVCVIGVRV